MPSESQANQPKYLQIKALIKKMILSGELRDQLPPERELAKMHAVSYMTVRRAIGEMEEEGLLFRDQGRGTYVCPPGKIARRTYALAFIMPDFIRHELANPYYSHVINGAQKEAQMHRYHLLFATRLEDVFPFEEGRLPREVRRKADGAILVTPRSWQAVMELRRFMPLAALDAAGGEFNLPTVNADNRQGARTAVEHLISRGHRRIAHLCGDRSRHVAGERLAGYQDALAQAGLESDPELILPGDWEFESGRAAAVSLLRFKPPPTAVFCANDSMALGLIRGLFTLGLQVPRDMSVVGFDDIQAGEMATPPLTTMRIPKAEIGAQVVRLLLDVIADREEKPCPTVRLPVTLVERGSVTRAPGQRHGTATFTAV